MGRIKETLWEAEPHTLAKIKIVENYLKAWTIILSRTSNNPLLIIDGFAGPGRYADGKEGSPIASLKVVLGHTQEFKVPVEFVFIEKELSRYKYLCKEISKFKSQILASDKILTLPRIIHGNCESELNNIIDEYRSKRGTLGPAFVFLDQFGYTNVSMDLIAKIMSFRKCEVFVYLNWNDFNHYLPDKKKWGSITKAFGSEKWKRVLNFGNKMEFIENTYIESLKENAKSKYVWPFKMKDVNNRCLYWLFFCSQHPKGLREMKLAMGRVASSGRFVFSDKDNKNQISLLSLFDSQSIKFRLIEKFKGKTVTSKEVHEFVLNEKLPVNFASILKEMLKNNEIEIINKSEKQSISFIKDLSLQIRFN